MSDVIKLWEKAEDWLEDENVKQEITSNYSDAPIGAVRTFINDYKNGYFKTPLSEEPRP